MNIKKIRDITDIESNGIIVQVVNCVGNMDNGISLSIRNKWPEVYETFISFSKKWHDMFGVVHLIDISKSDRLYVANIYAQRFCGDGMKLSDINIILNSLEYILEKARVIKIPVYIPKLGCGGGGLSWTYDLKPQLSKIINKYKDVETYICIREKEK